MDTAATAGVLTVLPLLLWVVWWLCAVNWKRMWPVLGQGGWAPAVLLLMMVAVVWSRLQPYPAGWFPGVAVPNFLWQLLAVGGLALLALFCGWLQGRLHWGPHEISLEPPDAADDALAHHH